MTKLTKFSRAIRKTTGKRIPLILTTGLKDQTVRGATDKQTIFINAKTNKTDTEILETISHELVHIFNPGIKEKNNQVFDYFMNQFFKELEKNL